MKKLIYVFSPEELLAHVDYRDWLPNDYREHNYPAILEWVESDDPHWCGHYNWCDNLTALDYYQNACDHYQAEVKNLEMKLKEAKHKLKLCQLMLADEEAE